MTYSCKRGEISSNPCIAHLLVGDFLEDRVGPGKPLEHEIEGLLDALHDELTLSFVLRTVRRENGDVPQELDCERQSG